MLRRNLGKQILTYGAIIVVCLMFVFPVFFMLSTSFKTRTQVFTAHPVWLFIPTLENYAKVIFQRNYTGFIYNSSLIALISTGLTLLISIPAAYALAKLKLKGEKDIAFWILSVRMLPPIVALIPLFVIFKNLHLLGTYTSLILLYQILNIPLVVWMLRGFFIEIPDEVEEAALIDGCSTWGVLFRIMLPIAKTGLAATAMLSIVFCWNEFLFASIFTQIETRTLPVSVTQFIRLRGVVWGEMTAATTITVIPVWILCVIIQKHLVRGLSFGALH